MSLPVDRAALDTLFHQARTHSHWLDKPVPDATLQMLYELTRLGPTSANCSPGRFVFVKTPAGKELLRPAVSAGNIEKTISAPVTVIVASDMAFYEKLPGLYPLADARSWFTSSETLAKETAFRNSSLQAGYLMISARALGLDAGPMSGFDAERINQDFFHGTDWQVNLLINLGYGDATKLHDRLPRPDFEEACRFA